MSWLPLEFLLPSTTHGRENSAIRHKLQFHPGSPGISRTGGICQESTEKVSGSENLAGNGRRKLGESFSIFTSKIKDFAENDDRPRLWVKESLSLRPHSLTEENIGMPLEWVSAASYTGQPEYLTMRILDLESNLQFKDDILSYRFDCFEAPRTAFPFNTNFAESRGSLNFEYMETRAENCLDCLKLELNEILMAYPDGILLSILNKFFSVYWGKKLSPAIFGYTHTLSLLLSEELRHVCRLYFDSFKQLVVQSTQFKIPKGVRLLEVEMPWAREKQLDLSFPQARTVSDTSFNNMRLTGAYGEEADIWGIGSWW
ncbi:OST-HTH Associated domain protein [Cryptosporidium felis]|nr:OST-HTH Associated domain protein [Cryptosporidium felis]